MNKVFKTVWNASLGVWVAVSETAAGQKKGSNKLKKAAANAVATVVVGAATISGVHAGWNNGQGTAATDSIAIGSAEGKADASAEQATAVGTGSKAGSGSVSLGYKADSTGQDALALGSNSKATVSSTIAIGANSQATAVNSLSIGTSSGAIGKDSTTIGAYAAATQEGATSIGQAAQAKGIDAIAIGKTALASGKNAIAIGKGTKAEFEDSIAIGSKAVVSQKGSIVIGTGTASGANSTVIGGGEASGIEAQVFGGGTASGEKAKVFGGGTASGMSAQVFGIGEAAGDYAHVFGSGKATAEHALVLGAGEASAKNSMALGTSTVLAEDSVAVGGSNTINLGATKSFILGSNVVLNNANSVVLGDNSVLRNIHYQEVVNNPVITKLDNDGNVILNSEEDRRYTMSFAGTTTDGASGAVSVGSFGKERQIQYVGAGRITSASTDAVNGSQLYAVLTEVAKLEEKPITFVNVDKDGKPLTQTVDVLDADGQPTYDPDTGEKITQEVPLQSQVKLGDTFNIQGATVTIGEDGKPVLKVDAAAASSWNLSAQNAEGNSETATIGGNKNKVEFAGDQNITVQQTQGAEGTKLEVKLADQIQLTENGGLTIAAGDVFVLDAQGNKIPEEDADGNPVLDAEGNPVYVTQNYPNAITINQGNINFGGNVLSGVAPGVAGTDAVNVNQLNGSGWTIKGKNAANQAVTGNVAKDNVVDFKAGTSNNLTVNTQLVEKPLLDEKGQPVLDANGQPVMTHDAEVVVELADQVNLTKDGGLTIAGGGTYNLLDADGNALPTTYVAGDINLQQGNVSFGGNQIHDVAAGTALTDGVNVSQLKDAVDTLGGGATVNPDGSIKAPEYIVGAGNQKVDNVGDAIDVLNQGFTLTSSNAVNKSEEKIQAGDTVDITVTKDKNLEVTQTDNKIEFALADQVNLTKDGGLTVAGGGTYNLLDAQGNPLPTTYVAGDINLKQGNVSFGGNQIHNVAAGTAPTDAVNVSQLQSSGWNIITQDKDAEGKVTGNTENAVNGDKAANNSSVQFNGDNNISVSQTSQEVKDKDGNVVGTETVIAVELEKDVDLSADGSLTIGDTSVNNDGLTIAGIPKLDPNTGLALTDPITGLPIYEQGRAPIVINQGNVNFGGNVIGGVAKGVADDDAVNVSQLKDEIGKAVSDSGWTLTTGGVAADQGEKIKPNTTVDFSGDDVGNIQVSNEGSNVKVELNPNLDLGKDGSVSIGDTLLNGEGLTVGDITIQEGENGVNFAGNQINNVGTATEDHQAVNLGQLKDEIGGLEETINNNIANSGWNLTGTDAAGNTVSEKVNPDDTVEFVAGPSGNTTVTTETTPNGAKVTVDINDQLNLTQDGGLTIAGGNQFNALDNQGKPIQAQDANGNPLTNADGSPQYVTYTTSDINLQQGNISVGGNQIHDVAKGTAGTDAVNVDQLKGAVNIFGGGAAVNPDGSIEAPTYNVNGGSYNNVGDALGALNQADIDLGDRVTNLQQSFNNRIDDVEDRMSAGIAAAMALETAPYVPGKYTYAAATAYHNGQAALGVTLRKTADNGRWSLTGGVAAGTEGDPSVRLGVSGIID